jgi:phosphohistidine phosphatase SixA
MPASPARRALLWAPALALCPGGVGAAETPAGPLQADAPADDEVARLLRAGGVVVALRHALAPGTFDPPGFVLADCATQRNLSEAGREQARRIGRWFAERRLVPARVRSSPWCRCRDTAQLAFGGAELWPALGSPAGQPETVNAAHRDQLRAGLAQADRRGFEVWVTHNFVLQALARQGADSGEALLLRAGPPADGGAVRVLGRLAAG